MSVLDYVMGMKSAGAGGGSTGGGGDAVRITMSWDGVSDSYTIDKTYEELMDLIAEGTFLYVTGHKTGAIMIPSTVDEYNGIIFSSVPRGAFGGGKAYSYEMLVTADNSVITYNTQITASTLEDGD